MISIEFKYKEPKSYQELLELLAAEKNSMVLSGGYSLVRQLKANLIEGNCIISTASIAELDGIIVDDDKNINIGSSMLLSSIVNDAVASTRLPALHQAIKYIGDMQYCNQTSIGDEFSYSWESSRILAVLIAYNTIFQYENKYKLTECFEPFKPQSDFILKYLCIKESADFVCYEEIRDQVNGLPQCGIACSISAENETIKSAKIVMCSRGLNTATLEEAQASIIGQAYSDLNNLEIPISYAIKSPYYSSEYFSNLINILIKQCIARYACSND